jgi:hypothetical protein
VRPLRLCDAGMEAIDTSGGGEVLTALGSHLSCLPTDVRIGKFILLCAIFNVVDEGLTIASILGTRSPFVAPFEKRDAADAAKRSFASGQSDHLAAMAAYQMFDATVGQAKYEFAREHFLGIKTLQTIGSLKRQLLELLSDAGFVPAGLRARAVEAAGRRAGGSDGVALVMKNGLGPPPGQDGAARGPKAPAEAERRTDLNDGLPYTRAQFVEEYGGTREWEMAKPANGTANGGANGGANGQGLAGAIASLAIRNDNGRTSAAAAATVNGANGALLKALLCAALYPQIVVVEGGKKADGGKGGGGKGGKGGGGLKFMVREVGVKEPVAVALHPSSVNARESQFESKYLIYAEMIRTTQIYVRDSSPVSPYALMLFGGGLVAESPNGAGGGSSARGAKKASDEVSVLVVDSWIRFRVPNRVERLILDVRSQLSALLMRKIEKPELEFSSAGKGILNAVTALLAAPPPEL